MKDSKPVSFEAQHSTRSHVAIRMLQVHMVPKVVLLYLACFKVLSGHSTLPVLCGSLAEILRPYESICQRRCATEWPKEV